jgi:DNA (cytosine-5)-methyltransferase 1
MSAWVAESLTRPAQPYRGSGDRPIGSSWPTAAWGDHTGEFAAPGVTLWPRVTPTDPIEKFLDDAAPLSARASAGFLKRARAGSLRFVAGFLDDVEAHLATMTTMERSA